MRRLEALERRRLDESTLVKAAMTNEVYRRIKDSEAVRYAIGAMQPIDPEYTKHTYAQGDRVKGQLTERVSVNCDYEYQGSTTTDTHIKARSDIDLLMIHKDWYWTDPPQSSSYTGNPVADMLLLRNKAVVALGAAFPQVNLDDSKPRAIKLSGGSLTRNVDVVPASWYHTTDYNRTQDKTFKGVKILDRDSRAFEANTPFLHKRRIEDRDQLTRGGLRKAIRLMKSLMYDSEGRLDISSYNIVGIAYNIPESHITVQAPKELMILEACVLHCESIERDSTKRLGLLVPDGSRSVFGGQAGATQLQLSALTIELNALRRDVINDNTRAFRRLEEARVEYQDTWWNR